MPAGKGKPPREEEEEPTRVRPKVTLRVDEAPTLTRPGSVPVHLAREAEQARHEAARQLYRRLAVPRDVVHFPAGSAHEVAPLADFFDPKDAPGATLVLEPTDGKPAFKVTRRQIARVEPYEALALRLVGDFLKGVNDFKDFPAVPEREGLGDAEKVLAEVVRFHESARQRGLRKGRVGWDELEKQLRARLLDVRLQHLEALVRDQQWQPAQDLAEQLAEIYPGHPRIQSALVRLRVQQIDRTLEGDRLEAFSQARRALDELLRQFPQAGEEEPVRRLRGRLRQKADALLKTCETLAELQRAELLRTVETIWPELPGLQKYLEKGKGYRILNVGVRHLPERLSPATAWVDAEKLALDLLFESLVRLVPDPVVGQRYEPLLAAGSPEQLLLGRQFELIRGARWYRDAGDGPPVNEPVLAADVSRTVLAYQKWPARSAEWKDLLGGAQVEGDQYSVRLTLQQGYVDPLALMSFRVLPARLVQQPDDPEFARQPVGSGPYQFAGKVDGLGRKPYVRFLLNPTWKRPGKTEPEIREIRFHEIGDLRLDLVHIPLHVAYDLDAEQLKEVRSPQAGIANVRIVSLPDRSRPQPPPNRRVWFLAVNHRKRPLQDENLRRAIGLAIDRERILDDCFRGKNALQEPDRTVHRVLTGPYPAGSWACNANPLLDVYKPDLARGLGKGLAGTSLTLKYPTGLPGVAAACQQIQEQVRRETGIQLVLRPVPWRQLHDEVELQHDYDLAYYCWDHADDRYWLGPLFDPAGAGRGGRNFLGLVDDPQLQDLFRQARSRRQFTQLQQLTHLIHQHINQRMHLIPLWQLDTHVVLRSEVQTAPAPNQLDAAALFGQVEEWRLR